MPPRSILVISEGQLGDLLLLTPALRSLKTSFPDSRLTVLVVQRRSYGEESLTYLVEHPTSGTSEVLTLAPFVDEVLEVHRARLRSLHGWRRLRAEAAIVTHLRARHFDTALCCFEEDRFSLWARLSGAGRRIGPGGPLRWLLTDTVDADREQIGVLDYYCALAEKAGARIDSRKTELAIPDDARRRARGLLDQVGIREGEPFIVVHPGASGPYRVWPPERFAEVIEHLRVKKSILLCGTSFDRSAREEVARLTEVPTLELSGSLADFAALLEKAVLCLSNDSGPRHVAIAVGTPSLAILPRLRDRAWGVYGKNQSILLGHESCPACPSDRCLDRMGEGETFGSYCMRMVTVEAVLEEAERLISGEGA